MLTDMYVVDNEHQLWVEIGIKLPIMPIRLDENLICLQ